MLIDKAPAIAWLFLLQYCIDAICIAVFLLYYWVLFLQVLQSCAHLVDIFLFSDSGDTLFLGLVSDVGLFDSSI